MEKTFMLKNKQIACTLDGDSNNPPIIMLHDWASYRGIWQTTISVLKTKYYCISIDLLGFGASDKPDDSDYNLTSQGQLVLLLADRLGLQKFSVLGHSMGGQIAMLIAANLAPQRIEKLVIVNGIVTGKFSEKFEKFVSPVIGMARKLPWFYMLGKALINFRPFIIIAFKHWFYNIDTIPLNIWEAARNAAYNQACAISSDKSLKAIRELDLTLQLRKIQSHTLIIAGKQDSTVPLDQALLAQTLIPNSDLALIEKCGHFPMLEKDRNYLKALALAF
jgi:pimeloyl-ACP methyl ester carboxylesterase